MRILDDLLNRITMYRLVVYGLIGLIIVALGFALTGQLSFSPTGMVVSLGLLLGSAYAANWLFGWIWRVPTNSESWLITALILFLILPAADNVASGLALVLAGAFSSASKFIVAWRGRHIFNPAALAAALLSLTGAGATTWWIGSSLLWPFSLVVGIAVTRKIRRVPLVATFAVVAIVLQAALLISSHRSLGTSMQQAIVSSPLIFLATIMLTEPATMPPRRRQQMVFGTIAAVLYVTSWQIGPLTVYPEVALLLANIYAFAVAPKFRVRLRLREVQRISDRVYNYIFTPDRKFSFLPGQYMEWTLAGVPYDSRGNRRTLTIASSPTEDTVQLGIKFYEPASTYKATMATMRVGDEIYASQLAGNFTLSGNEQNKLVFIAGGIGITPFRSMVKNLVDTGTKCDIVILYVVGTPDELAYIDVLRAATAHGIKTIPIVTHPQAATDRYLSAKLRPELIAKLVPDYAERQYYISGPDRMVDASRGYLRQLGVRSRSIMTDHFSGY